MIGEKRKITRGPWQVIREEHPHHLGGKHVEFRIFTTWSHPQLKGPMPVVNGSVGVGAEKGGPPRHMVWIDEADAYLIAAAPDLLQALVAARAEIWRLLDAKGVEPKQAREWPEIVAAENAIAKATTIQAPGAAPE